MEGRVWEKKEEEEWFEEKLSGLSLHLVPWWRDILHWEKKSSQNKTALLSVFPLILPASSDIHPSPSTLGRESSGLTQKVPKAS